MRDRRRRDAPPLAPGTPVKDSCDRCQQHVEPVEMGAAEVSLVEVRQAEQNGCGCERCPPSDASFQKVLHPRPKEEFFGNSDEYENPSPRQRPFTNRWPGSMRMDKSKRQSQTQHEGSKKRQLA